MKKSPSKDLLADPEIRRRTERILALQREEKQTRKRLGEIVAAIGAELIAVKAALDRLSGKTAWQRWLKDHVHYTIKTAQNYMSVARFAEKNENVFVFLIRIPASCIASLRCRIRAPPSSRPIRC
jgi:hypothetical protein